MDKLARQKIKEILQTIDVSPEDIEHTVEAIDREFHLFSMRRYEYTKLRRTIEADVVREQLRKAADKTFEKGKNNC